jgi:hypothetical protein
MNILIRARKDLVQHKFKSELLKEYNNELPEGLYCYWSGIHPTRPNLNKVMFTNGKTVYAEGKIIGVDLIEGLKFEPLTEVDYPQPRLAPTRGFTYVL